MRHHTDSREEIAVTKGALSEIVGIDSVVENDEFRALRLFIVILVLNSQPFSRTRLNVFESLGFSELLVNKHSRVAVLHPLPIALLLQEQLIL